MTAPPDAVRLFALLEWDDQLGAPLVLVAVLGVDASQASGGFVVEWVPHTGSAAARWAERLHDGVDESSLNRWSDEDATLGLVELELPDAADDLRTAVAMALDTLLATPDQREAGA